MTIREFAKAIGVSQTTVSRAMHGRGRLSPATRQMVLTRMKELGYTPNLNAQRLSRGRTNLVALDFGPSHDYLSDMFFAELTRELQDVLEDPGFGLLLSGPGQALNRWVKTCAVDGVILVGEPKSETILHEITCTGTPCVIVGNHPVRDIPGVGSVVVELQSGTRQTAHLLAERGHANIGFIASEHIDSVFFEFRDALERLGIPLPDSNVVQGCVTPADGGKALCELLSLADPPTAIFARTDGFAAGALHAAHRIGVRIPEDLSIVGHDDVPLAELMEPPLTTVRVDCLELARLAADAMFSLLNDTKMPLEPKSVHTELVVRDSVSAPRLWALAHREPMRPLMHRDADGRGPA